MKEGCRCGTMAERLSCHALELGSVHAPVCERVCDTKRSCGKHRCSAMCCADRGDPTAAVHECTLVCGKALRCGSHTCEERCHRGHCPPCYHTNWDELTCNCGMEVRALLGCYSGATWLLPGCF